MYSVKFQVHKKCNKTGHFVRACKTENKKEVNNLESCIKGELVYKEATVFGKKILFLIDSGSSVSIIEESCLNDIKEKFGLKKTDIKLKYFNDVKIKVKGVLKLSFFQ